MSSPKSIRLLPILVAVLFGCVHDEPITPAQPSPLRAYEVVRQGSVVRADFSYNNEGILLRLDWKRGTPSLTQGSDTFLYDAKGNVIKLVRSITGLNDEHIVFSLENERVMVSEHYVNEERLSYIFYNYNAQGQLIRTEQSNRIPGGGGYLRGKETEFSYNADGNLYEIKEYSFDESTAKLVLNSVYTFSGFTSALNPLQPVDVLPNMIFQRNLPTGLAIESNGQRKVYTYEYVLRKDRQPSQRIDRVGSTIETTVKYEY